MLGGDVNQSVSVHVITHLVRPRFVPSSVSFLNDMQMKYYQAQKGQYKKQSG